MVTLYSLLFCLSLYDLKVAQSDAMSPELPWSSSSEVREVQGRLRSPPRSVSPHRHTSPTLSSSPVGLDSALQAVQAAIERRQQREQVCDHSPQGHQSYKSCPAGAPLQNFSQPDLVQGRGGGVGGQVSTEPVAEL